MLQRLGITLSLLGLGAQFLGDWVKIGVSELVFPSYRIYLPIHRFRLEVGGWPAENVRVKNLWFDLVGRIQLS